MYPICILAGLRPCRGQNKEMKTIWESLIVGSTDESRETTGTRRLNTRSPVQITRRHFCEATNSAHPTPPHNPSPGSINSQNIQHEVASQAAKLTQYQRLSFSLIRTPHGGVPDMHAILGVECDDCTRNAMRVDQCATHHVEQRFFLPSTSHNFNH